MPADLAEVSIQKNLSSKSKSIEESFQDYVNSENHPCIMAKSLFAMKSYTLRNYGSMSYPNIALKLNQDIANFIETYDFGSNTFSSFIAVFENDIFDNEIEFERALWQLLQSIHDNDHKDWDKTVSSNIEDSNFSFSIQGMAFYIVGLHPKSSRIARRSPYVSIAFNLHFQFEKLREMGTFHNVRNRIRKNDKRIQGSINPVLKDFGHDTEVKQYSGRAIDESWKCPFLNKNI